MIGLIPWPYKAALALGLFLAYSGGLSWWCYSEGRAKERGLQVASELAQTQTVLKDFQTATLAMNSLAGQYTQIAQGLDTQIDALSGRFRNVTRASPLPDSCKPSPDRVRFLTEAIAATNSAIGRGASPAVPPNPPAN